jgi:hypothetical protein
MRSWKFLIILSSAASALAVGLGAQAQAEHADLLALLNNALNGIT